MTLNQIAEDIAYKLGDQFNHTLKESIKHTLIIYRSKFIRDDISKNGINANTYYQSVVLEFEKVNKLSDVGADVSCLASICSYAKEDKKFIILKSKKQIPAFIKLKSAGNSPFKFLGSVDRLKRFKYATPDTLEYITYLPYQKNEIYYYISDNYVYLLNSTEICNTLIEGIFDNPREAYPLCEGNNFKDDNEFPISNDLLFYIVNNIVTREYPLINKDDGDEINLQSDTGNDKSKSNV